MSIETINLKVIDICGPHCVGLEDGDSLFTKILSILKSGNNIVLDFSEIATITSSFLNASVGKLFGQFAHDDLDKRLRCANLDVTDEELIALVVKNAKEHFNKPAAINQAEDDIVRKVPEED